MIQNPPLAALAPPKVIQNIPLAALDPPVVLLIQLSIENDTTYSHGCIGSSSGRFSFNSSLKVIQNAFVDALAPPVVVSFSILN